jgi:hypothetical protein
MNIPIIGKAIDERFLSHRRQSTSIAGVIGGLLATSLFAYRYYIDHFWSWDLFAVAAAIVVIKMAVLIWHLLTD